MGAGSDDRVKTGLLCSEHAHLLLELERDPALGAPHEPAFEQSHERCIGELRGAAHQLDLAGILDHPQTLDDLDADQLDSVGKQRRAAARAGALDMCASSNPRRTAPDGSASATQSLRS